MAVKFNTVNQTPIAEGGEGCIYEYGNQVIKVFKDTVDITAKERKVKSLLKLNLPSFIICPKDEVVDAKGKFIGYLMDRVYADEFKRLANRKYVVANNISTKDILEMLVKIQKTLAVLHNNNIFVGDLNDQNILFDRKNNVFFIDCDSWSIGSDHCSVAMDLFRDPKLVADHFNADTDHYAFAILAWKSLTRLHPFGGTMTPDMRILDRMQKGISVIDRADITVPKTVKSWKWVSPNLVKEFKNVFNDGGRTELNSLQDVCDNLCQCPKDGEYYFNKFTSCPFCNENAEVRMKPMSCGTMSGLKCFAVYNPDKVKIMFGKGVYLDQDNNIHVDKHTTKYTQGVQYHYLENGMQILEYASYFVVYSKQEYHFEKKFKTNIAVDGNHVYFVSEQNSFKKIEVRPEGNFITQICKCSNRSFFEVSDGDFCLVNYYDDQLIVNINGMNTVIKYPKKITNYGLHKDSVTKKWLLLFENEDGKFNTIVIDKNKVEFTTDAIRYQCQLSSVCFSNTTIFIPIDQKIRGYSYSKQAFKDFECTVVSDDSSLSRKGKGFIIVNPENMYVLE